MPATKSKTSKEKVRAHRARLRRRGLRPVQMWVPDVRSPAFARQAHKQSALIATAASEADEQRFIDAISEWPSE